MAAVIDGINSVYLRRIRVYGCYVFVSVSHREEHSHALKGTRSQRGYVNKTGEALITTHSDITPLDLYIADSCLCYIVL